MVWFSHRRFFLFSFLGIMFVISSLFLAIPPHVAAANATWVSIPTPKQPKTDNTLFSIASISSTDAWTVGNSGTTSSTNSLIEHWNGRSWKIIPAAQVNPGQEALAAVAAVSRNDVWAVGTTSYSRALIEHWNGKQWSVVPAPAPPPPNDSYSLSAVTALSSTDVWAVGYHVFYGGQQSLALHWDGTAWSVIPTPTITQGGINSPADDALSSITAISSHDIWASGSLNYGNQGLIEHWDGTSWNVIPSPAPTTVSNIYTLNSIAADASGHVWAVGQYLDVQILPLIEQWTGTSWVVVSSPLPPTIGFNEEVSLSGVTVVSGTSAWAVGSYYASTPSSTYVGDTLVEHWDGTAWTVVPSPNVGTADGLNAVTSFHGQTGAVGSSQTANHSSTLVIWCNCA